MAQNGLKTGGYAHIPQLYPQTCLKIGALMTPIFKILKFSDGPQKSRLVALF
jgi:hypothetical protein